MNNYESKLISYFLIFLILFLLVPFNIAKAAEVSGAVPTFDAANKALSFLYNQQDPPAYQTSIRFDKSYDDDYSGEISGRVDLSKIDVDSTSKKPYLSLNASYDSGYQGTISGQVSGIDNPNNYKVRIYNVTDIEYLIATVSLNGDGTWESDNITIHGTLKAYLISADNSIITDDSVNTEVSNLNGYEIKIYSESDIPYLQCTIPLNADGTFSTYGSPHYDDLGDILNIYPSVQPGIKIARLVRLSDNKILATTEIPKYNLIRSYYIPDDDAAKRYVGGRSWIYDDALAVISFSIDGNQKRAQSILNSLQSLQNSDGSLEFSYDIYTGSLQQRIQSGSIAWVGDASVYYAKKFGDTSYIQFTKKMADYLLTLQNYDTGSIKGGPDVSWYSTEHNIDSYFFFRDLGALTNDSKYIEAAQKIKQSLLENHWNSSKKQFNQGIGDEETTLDVNSWGGIFLNSIGRRDLSSYCENAMNAFKVDGKSISKSSDSITYNMTYSLDESLSGFKPYLQTGSYANSPSVVWAEGTWGAITFLQREGKNTDDYINSMLKMQSVDPDGGTVYSNLGDNDAAGVYSFHVWPAVAAATWEYITIKDPNGIWTCDDNITITPAEGMSNVDSSSNIKKVNGVMPNAITNDPTYQKIKDAFVNYVVGISNDIFFLGLKINCERGNKNDAIIEQFKTYLKWRIHQKTHNNLSWFFYV